MMDIEYSSPPPPSHYNHLFPADGRTGVKDIVRRLEDEMVSPLRESSSSIGSFRSSSSSSILTRSSITSVSSISSNISSASTTVTHGSEHINVYLRVRPNPHSTDKNISDSSESSIKITDDQTILFRTGKQMSEECDKYTFNKVFPQHSTQQHVFEYTTVPLIDNMFNGFDALLLAYGVTNAGKTFTIMGKLEYEEEEVIMTGTGKKKRQTTGGAGVMMNRDTSKDGVIPRTLQEVFDRIRGKEDEYGVMISYYELYNERIYDLLNVQMETTRSETGFGEPKRRIHLKTGEEKGRVVIKELTCRTIDTPQEGKELLMRGNQNRKVGKTALNRDSSRSHGVFTISLVKKNVNGSVTEHGKISIVDLAGAERASRTNAGGDRLKEASGINKSLLVLGRCIQAIVLRQSSKSQIQIPYRESEITKIFKNELIGKARVCMIVNISPSMNDAEETANVMKYAAIAKDIKTNSRIDMTRKTFMSPKLFSPKATPKTATRQAKIATDKKKKTNTAPTRILFFNDDNDKTDEFHVDTTLIEELKKQLLCNEEFVVSRLNIERAIREEVVNEMAEQMDEMEKEHQNHLESELLRAEEKYEKAIEGMNKTANSYKEQIELLEMQFAKYKGRAVRSNNELNTSLAIKTQEVENLKAEIAYLREAMNSTDANATIKTVETQKEKLILQRQLDEVSDTLAQYKKYQRENEFLTQKNVDLTKELDEARVYHKLEIETILKEEAEKRERIKSELEQKHKEHMEIFEVTTKEKFFKQFQSKTDIETEAVNQELKMLKLKYESEISEKKILLEAYNQLKQQIEDASKPPLSVMSQTPSTPNRNPSIAQSVRSGLKKLIHTPKRTSTPVKPIPFRSSPRNSLIVGKKRKSDEAFIILDVETPVKKIRLSSPDLKINTQKSPPPKLQTTNRNESPKTPTEKDNPSSFAPVPQKSKRTLRLIKPGTKNLLDVDSPVPKRTGRATKSLKKPTASSRAKATTKGKKSSKKVSDSEEEESDESSPEKRRPTVVKKLAKTVTNLRKRATTTRKKYESSEDESGDESASEESEGDSGSEYEPSPMPKRRRGRAAATKKTTRKVK